MRAVASWVLLRLKYSQTTPIASVLFPLRKLRLLPLCVVLALASAGAAWALTQSSRLPSTVTVTTPLTATQPKSAGSYVPDPHGCQEWFVAITVCSPSALRQLIDQHRMNSKSTLFLTFTLHGWLPSYHSGGSGNGLFQVLGEPLPTGTSFEIRGSTPADAILYLAAVDRVTGWAIQAKFTNLSLSHGGQIHVSVAHTRTIPRIRMTTPEKKHVAPTVVFVGKVH